MTPYVDILCLAAGPKGAVLIQKTRVSVFRADTRLVDFETHDGRHDRTYAIGVLARRLQ